MTDLTKYASGQQLEPLRPAGLTRREDRQHRRALTRMRHQADLQSEAISLEAELGQQKVQTVAAVGNSAMTAQALISEREKLLVESCPSAVHGIAHISTKLTMGLGQIVDHVVREVTR